MRDHMTLLAEVNIRYWIWLMEKKGPQAAKRPDPPLEFTLRTHDEIDHEEV
ncbi:MAG: hypothetical protein HY714_02955 [Candidatus Omnitrophica bacterium]|nr:hypothetical protein [Candidatus Omnitrophota bacterium]